MNFQNKNNIQIQIIKKQKKEIIKIKLYMIKILKVLIILVIQVVIMKIIIIQKKNILIQIYQMNNCEIL